MDGRSILGPTILLLLSRYNHRISCLVVVSASALSLATILISMVRIVVDRGGGGDDREIKNVDICR